MASSSSNTGGDSRQENARQVPGDNSNGDDTNQLAANSEMSIMNLFPELLLEIFLRLPAFAIIYCKGVCKIWYDILSSPMFTNFYIGNPSYVHLVSFDNQKVRYSEASLDSHLLEFGEDGGSTEKPACCKRLNVPIKDNLMVSGSCNGLLCLVEYSNSSEIIHVSNPITGEYISLPRFTPSKKCILGYGLGYSSHYKVLRFQTMQLSREMVKVEAQIYTIGVDQEWRELVFDEIRMCCLNDSAVTVNEAFHWMVDHQIERGLSEDSIIRREIIYAFDIGEEKFRSIQPPPVENGSMILGELRNCLCAFDHSNVLQLEIWTMEEYGREQSWTKDIILRSWIDSAGPNMVIPEPITVWKNGEILMGGLGGPNLISFNPQKENSYAIKVSGFESNSPFDMLSHPILFAPSFVSLREVARGRNLEVLQVEA